MPTKSQIEHRSKLIKTEAHKLGFTYIGFSKATFLEEEAPKLESWLKNNYHGKMSYMENHFDKRLDPRLLVEGTKTVVSLLYNYYPKEQQADTTVPKVSKYAYGKDYHFVIKDKLKALVGFIQENVGEVDGRVFVDSAPILERSWAQKSGLGWVGKNANLINKGSGSFYFLAEMLIDLELDYDAAYNKDYCGTCTKCIDACPTDAIVEPTVIDGSRCISYFTIELKEAIPAEMKGKFENWMFGCDICQDVCPWNRFSKPHSEPHFEPHKDLLNLSSADWQDLTKDVFNELFRKSAVKRTKYEGLKRNIRFLEEE